MPLLSSWPTEFSHFPLPFPFFFSSTKTLFISLGHQFCTPINLKIMIITFLQFKPPILTRKVMFTWHSNTSCAPAPLVLSRPLPFFPWWSVLCNRTLLEPCRTFRAPLHYVRALLAQLIPVFLKKGDHLLGEEWRGIPPPGRCQTEQHMEPVGASSRTNCGT